MLYNRFSFIKLIFNENKIDTIYHAACKQVPLVEENVISAVKIMFGTQNLVRLSYKYSI